MSRLEGKLGEWRLRTKLKRPGEVLGVGTDEGNRLSCLEEKERLSGIIKLYQLMTYYSSQRYRGQV